jgi:cephalosporin hydroxylase
MADVEQEFHDLYYRDMEHTWMDTRWRGVNVHKNPMDLWVQQEIIFECKPELIIECGTSRGGSSLFYADMLDMLGAGMVLTFDLLDARDPAAAHPRVTFLERSDTSRSAGEMAIELAKDALTMVVLDSNHTAEHVAGQLALYAPMVSVGQYLVVEDTNVGQGSRVWPEFDDGKGPAFALDEWYREFGHQFVIDQSRERLHLTFNPGGYLKRIA